MAHGVPDIKPSPIITDHYLQAGIFIRKTDGGFSGFRMLENILQAFLDNAEKNQLFCLRDRPARPLDRKGTQQKAASPDPVYFLFDTCIQVEILYPVCAHT